MRTKYVLGFMFNEDMSKVVLIQKRRPDWQAGLLNGVGGKIKDTGEDLDLSAYHTMIRKFEEETGIKHLEWNKYAILVGKDFKVYVYFCCSPLANHVKTITDEIVYAFDSESIKAGSPNLVPNTDWLVALAMSGKPSLVTAEFY